MLRARRFLRRCPNTGDIPKTAGLLAICRNASTDTVSAETLAKDSPIGTQSAVFVSNSETDHDHNVSQLLNDGWASSQSLLRIQLRIGVLIPFCWTLEGGHQTIYSRLRMTQRSCELDWWLYRKLHEGNLLLWGVRKKRYSAMNMRQCPINELTQAPLKSGHYHLMKDLELLFVRAHVTCQASRYSCINFACSAQGSSREISYFNHTSKVRKRIQKCY